MYSVVGWTVRVVMCSDSHGRSRRENVRLLWRFAHTLQICFSLTMIIEPCIQPHVSICYSSKYMLHYKHSILNIQFPIKLYKMRVDIPPWNKLHYSTTPYNKLLSSMYIFMQSSAVLIRSRASYAVSFVMILEKTDRVIMALYYCTEIFTSDLYCKCSYQYIKELTYWNKWIR